MRLRASGTSHTVRPGIALLTVMVAIMLLSITVMEFLYSSRVKLALATNTRDEVKAYYNARSGINLLRLALEFQYELLDETGPIGTAVERSNFQLWQYLDLFLPTFVTARVDSPVGSLDLEETGAIGFGAIEGDIVFHDPIPEEGKLNLNSFAGNILEQEALLKLCTLFSPSQYDYLFGPAENAEGEALPTRGELIGSIIDYIDSDSDMVVVDETCQLIPSGLGAEERRYMDLSYRSKNEPLTTLDELMLVAGMTPELMENFRDNLTVYAVANQFFVNLADAQGFMGFLCAHILGNTETFNMCRSPIIAGQIAFLSLALEGWTAFFDNPFMLLDYYLGFSSGQAQERVAEGINRGQMIAFREPGQFLNMLNNFMGSPELAIQFAVMADPRRAQLFGYLASGGTALVPPRFAIQFDEQTIQQSISVDIPRVFTISATGSYGLATRTITAVVDFTQDGRLLYWREF